MTPRPELIHVVAISKNGLWIVRSVSQSTNRPEWILVYNILIGATIFSVIMRNSNCGKSWQNARLKLIKKE